MKNNILVLFLLLRMNIVGYYELDDDEDNCPYCVETYNPLKLEFRQTDSLFDPYFYAQQPD